jgi:hypothetical protein
VEVGGMEQGVDGAEFRMGGAEFGILTAVQR